MNETNEKELLSKINLLHQIFDKAGIPFYGKLADDFLLRPRAVLKNEEFIKETRKYYKHTHLIAPVLITVTPLSFENSGYGNNGIDTLLDWFLYRNSSSNSLVWDNIGKPSQEILKSFINQRAKSGPIIMNSAGQIFNGEDGNHRLLTLIINQFLERNSAKSKAEKLAIDKQYEMTLPCDFAYNAELVDLLENIEKQISIYNQDSQIPMLVRKFRDDLRQNNAWFVKYDPKTKLFTFNFNDEKFTGNEQDFIKYLHSRKQIKQPVMCWDCDGVYYASCYNKVYKSTSKQKIDKIFSKLKNNVDAVDNKPYLEIKDLDTNRYELHRGYMQYEDRELAKEIAQFEVDFIKDNAEILSYKTKQNMSKYRAECKDVLKFNINLCLDELIYENLSLEELFNLSAVFDDESAEIEKIENKYKNII